MKKILILSFLFSFYSCSNLTKNFTKSGEFSLRGGQFENQSWNESLNFKRYCWYHEVTMLYDLMLAPVNPKSPFYHWLSDYEKETLLKCKEAFLMIDYALDSKRINKKMVLNDFKKSGYEQLSLVGFSQHLKLHPNVEELSLNLYQVSGLCRKEEGNNQEQVKIRLPGFTEVSL